MVDQTINFRRGGGNQILHPNMGKANPIMEYDLDILLLIEWLHLP